MHGTTTRRSSLKNLGRIPVDGSQPPGHAGGPGPPSPDTPSGATALAPTYTLIPAIRYQPNGGTASEHGSRDCSHVADSQQRLISSVDAKAFNLLIDRIGVNMSYAPKAQIFHEEDPAESVYKVVYGSVCTCKILSDGRRQIGGFYLPGDFFGFECADEHNASAEALTNTEVLVIKKSTLAAVASRDAAIEHQLLLLMTRELGRLQERVFTLLKNAQERMGEFILDMEKRTSAGSLIELPMRRQDIADYLGLTIETVSRTLTSLENSAAIEIPTRHCVIVRDHFMLKTEMAERSEPPDVSSYSKKSTNKNNHGVDRRRKRTKGPLTGGSRSNTHRLHRNRAPG